MQRSQIFSRRYLIPCAAAAALAASGLMLHAAGPDDGPPPGDRGNRPPPPPMMRNLAPPVKIEGTVVGYNHAGRGEIDGFVLTVDGKSVQINFPPTIGAMVPTIAPQDKSVKILASKMESAGDHDVYEFRGLDDGKGAASTDPHAPEKKDGHADAHAEGTIKSLNYARRGEVDGATLDNGDFVHIGPREAQGLSLKVGDKLSADGPAITMPDGHQAVDADKVNGKTIDRPPRPEGGPGGPGGPRGPGQRGPGGQRGLGGADNRPAPGDSPEAGQNPPPAQ